MAIVVTPLGAAAQDGGFSGTSPWLVGSGVALGTGDVVVFASVDSVFGETIVGVTVGGVTATLIGATTDTFGSAWLAVGVNTPTGTISIATSGSYNLIGANWFLITGENPASALFTFVSNQSFGTTDPQPISGVVPAGGVGLAGMFCASGANNKNPTTWTNCVSPGDTTLEANVSTGNSMTVAGNYTTAVGSSVNVSASGTISYAFQVSEMMMVTFGPSGAAAPAPWYESGGVLVPHRQHIRASGGSPT